MPSNHELSAKGKRVMAKLAEIEAEMKQIGFWTEKPPRFEVNHYLEAPTFELWLQCIFIRHAAEAAQSDSYPAKSQVGLMAMRQYDYHDYIPQAQKLLQLLYEFDNIIEKD